MISSFYLYVYQLKMTHEYMDSVHFVGRLMSLVLRPILFPLVLSNYLIIIVVWHYDRRWNLYVFLFSLNFYNLWF